MVKKSGEKGEKRSRLNRSNLSSSQISTEPMKCSGKFKDDFDNLCAMKNIKYVPEIVSRSRRPGSALQNAILMQQQLSQQQQQQQKDQSELGSQTASKKTAASLAKSKANTLVSTNNTNNVNQNNVEVDHDIEQNPEVLDLPPKSFVLKDSPEYFKPKIHVEMDNPDKLDTVTEIYIKGWKIEKPLMEILHLCIPAVEQLNTLNLWNVGLDEDTVRLVSTMLPTCINLKTLILDNNPIRDPAYHILLYEENSNVQHLSLRNNMIDDLAARYISYGLGDVRRANKKLISLNLNSNSIGDEGAKSLARALRTNRHLLVLSLANNRIGDAGAKSFSEVISRFALTFEEILYRRQVISGRNADKSLSPLGRKLNGTSKDRPTSQNKSSTTNTAASETSKAGRKDKASSKKSNESTLSATAKGADQSSATHEKKSIKESTLSKTKKDERTLRKASLGDSRNPKSLKQSAKSSGKRTTRDTNELNINEPVEQTTFTPKNSALLEISPLTDIAENMDDNLLLIGNRTLLCLNLSRNCLTEKSIEYFLLGLQYQSTLMAIHQSAGTGLLRLVINNNKFSCDNENYLRLLEFLKQKDPFNKPPAVINANVNQHESESISGKESVQSRMKSGARH